MPKTTDRRTKKKKTGEEGKGTAAVPAVASVEPTSPLRRIREKQGVSQRVLAEKCGISRGRLRRLEGKEFDHVTYAELKRISGTLGVEPSEIFFASERLSCDFYLGKKGQDAFQWDAAGTGYRIVSLIPARKDLFVGKLSVLPKKLLSAAHTPQAGTIFIEMVLGKFRIEIGGQSYEIEEGDHLLFHGDVPYTLENPLLRDSEAILFTLPSFKS